MYIIAIIGVNKYVINRLKLDYIAFLVTIVSLVLSPSLVSIKVCYLIDPLLEVLLESH